MCFKILCLLILLNSLQTNARGRIPISKNLKNNTNSSEYLDLPRGFDPQSPPTNPLLYPFVTEQPALNKTSTTPGWRPIVTENVLVHSTDSTKPLIRERVSSSTEFQQDIVPIAGPVLESIVYGAWKPDPPVQPNLTLTKNEFMDKADDAVFSASLEKVLKGNLGGFIENIGNKKSIPDPADKSTSNESSENFSTAKKPINRKMGRRKIIASNNNLSNESKTIISLANSMEIIRVNATDPTLLNMAKQINESVEANNNSNTKNNQKLKENLNNSNQVSKEWPADFLNSPESEQAQGSSMQDNSFNFLGDSSEPPQALNGLYGNGIKSPTAAINITKMGVPFESQNSEEGPSICVPLAVREPSVSNPLEIVEVERVYCFPLPAPDIKSSIESINDTLTFDKDAQFNVLSYEELLASSVKSVHESTLWILSLSYLLIK